MILPLIQLAVIAAIGYCLCLWRKKARARASQTWESLVAQLRPDWSARELSDRFLWQEGVNISADDAWKRMEGPKGLWVMYQNARVMQEMATYASKHCGEIDRVLISTLHSDALQIKVCVLAALGQYAFTAASEGVRVNAFRAASLYTGMAARMTGLLQNHAAIMVPDFVAAM